MKQKLLQLMVPLMILCQSCSWYDFKSPGVESMKPKEEPKKKIKDPDLLTAPDVNELLDLTYVEAEYDYDPDYTNENDVNEYIDLGN